jgi:hypothetical protein
MNYRRVSLGLLWIGIAFLAIGFLGYDALLWFPLGLANAQALMRILLGVAGCLTWGSWLVAGGMLLTMVLPLNAFLVPLIAALVSGLLLLVIGGLRTLTRRIGLA